MHDAMARFVPDGASVCLGTALDALIPFAAGHELIRQRRRDLTLVGPISDMLFDQLVAAARDGRLRGLKGFSAKTEENVLEAVQRAQRDTGRVTIDVAMGVAASFLERLLTIPGVQRADHAGSLRRMAETIGDVDLLVASETSGPIMDAFTTHQDVDQILARGDTKSSVVTRSGSQVDLRVIRKGAWGAAMIYFTGSKPHNVRIREMAVRKGLKLNEYGLFEVETDTLIAAETETEVYERLGLPYIEPTLREDRGEIEAALAGELPQVVTLKQMRGDLHTHTHWSADGKNSLTEMVDAAKAKGYAYYAITDHSHYLREGRMEQQAREIDKAAKRVAPMKLLKGVEANIKADGTLDVPDEVLAERDWVVASIHTAFDRDPTERILATMDNPHVHCIGHLTGRKLSRREPMEIDLERVLEQAVETGTFLEINSQPDRLDLRDVNARVAGEAGVPVVISSDAHQVNALDYVEFGVAQARRAWLRADQVANTRTLAQLRKLMKK